MTAYVSVTRGIKCIDIFSAAESTLFGCESRIMQTLLHYECADEFAFTVFDTKGGIKYPISSRRGMVRDIVLESIR
jgi:hypothetical protein